MKNFLPRIAFAFCVLFGAVSGCSTPHSVSTKNPWSAGVAEIDITPPLGQRMAGYFDERRATGIHDPLKAKAFVLRQGNEQIALVFCDLVGISLNASQKARAEASRQTGIPVTNILICATHTHTGPLFDDIRQKYAHASAVAKLGYDPNETISYPDFLAERIAKAVVAAVRKVKPAQVEVGIGKQTGLSFNRRYRMKDEKVAFNPGQLNPNIVEPAGPNDPGVGMLLVREGGKFAGGVTVFAMHADTAGGSLYSADYPFFLQQTLRKQLGENYISAFAAGTCGDINHINTSVKEPTKGFPVSEHIGETLGKTVLANLPNAAPIQSPSLAVRSLKITLPLQEVTPEEVADARSKFEQLGDTNANFYMKVAAVKILDLADKGPNWPSEIQVFRLDADTAIVGLPCEIFVNLGLAIKAQSPFKKTLVISICNDRPSYVPTLKAFQEGSYEISNARVKPGTGEMLVETAVKMLHDIKN